MPNISVRKIDQQTYDRLRNMAESDGVSMEEKVRRILKQSVAITSKPGDLAVELFRPAWGDEAFQLPEREVEPPPSLRKR